jgi:hypothetical protein
MFHCTKHFHLLLCPHGYVIVPSYTTYVLIAFVFFYLNLSETYDDYVMLYSVRAWSSIFVYGHKLLLV